MVTVRDAKLETKAARARLASNRKPYWKTLVPAGFTWAIRKGTKTRRAYGWCGATSVVSVTALQPSALLMTFKTYQSAMETRIGLPMSTAQMLKTTSRAQNSLWLM